MIRMDDADDGSEDKRRTRGRSQISMTQHVRTSPISVLEKLQCYAMPVTAKRPYYKSFQHLVENRSVFFVQRAQATKYNNYKEKGRRRGTSILTARLKINNMRRTKTNKKSEVSKSICTSESSKEEGLAGSSAVYAERLLQLCSAIKSSQFGDCSTYSEEECIGIAEAILEADDFAAATSEFLDVSRQESQSILKTAFFNADDQDSQDSVTDENNGVLEDDDDVDSNASEDSVDAYIQEGECELCEREMKLTQHHLIPKCTWKIIKPRFANAAKPYRESNFEEVREIIDLGDELPEGLSTRTFTSGFSIRLFLSNYTANLCRACHSCVHSNHSNKELAESYNSIEKLLSDERIRKFCKWQNTQKPGKHKSFIKKKR